MKEVTVILILASIIGFGYFVVNMIVFLFQGYQFYWDAHGFSVFIGVVSLIVFIIAIIAWKLIKIEAHEDTKRNTERTKKIAKMEAEYQGVKAEYEQLYEQTCNHLSNHGLTLIKLKLPVTNLDDESYEKYEQFDALKSYHAIVTDGDFVVWSQASSLPPTHYAQSYFERTNYLGIEALHRFFSNDESDKADYIMSLPPDVWGIASEFVRTPGQGRRVWDVAEKPVVHRLPLSQISYFTTTGALSRHMKVTGSGGGSDIGGALLGGLIAGGAGAVIGSRTETNVSSELVTHDDRETILVAVGDDGKEKVLKMSPDSFVVLDKLMPEKNLEVVSEIKKRQLVGEKLASDTLAAPASLTDLLRDIAALRDDGIITEDEFNLKKQELLAKMQ